VARLRANASAAIVGSEDAAVATTRKAELTAMDSYETNRGMLMLLCCMGLQLHASRKRKALFHTRRAGPESPAFRMNTNARTWPESSKRRQLERFAV
jgi:hypothetical protein